MEVTTQYAGVSYAGYYATKTTSTTTFESTIDAQGAADEESMSAKNYTETVTSKESTGETMSAADVFKMLVETSKEEHKLTPDNIAVEEDWREMDDENWNKLLEHIDKYIDDFQSNIGKIQNMKGLMNLCYQYQKRERNLRLLGISIDIRLLFKILSIDIKQCKK